jgi:benzylsuccinate CoA-transferase BbsF subunit
MYQVGVSVLGEGLLDYAFNGRRTRRLGNRHPSFAPHGCYPCKGQDEWVVIAARDDVEWIAVCAAMDNPSLAWDPRFADVITRHDNQDELDEIIARWTAVKSQYEVAELLQRRGVPAGPVLDGQALLADPHFRARGYFEAVEHMPSTGLGRQEYVGRGWKMSGNDVHIRKPAPLLGEDNQYVLSQMLGLPQPQIDQLEQSDAVGQTLRGAQVPEAVPLDRQVELGWTVRYDSNYQRHTERLAERDDPAGP